MWPLSVVIASALETTKGNTAHELPLQKQEDDHGGNDREDRSRHQQIGILLCIGIREQAVETNGDGKHRGVLENQQGPEEILPLIDKGEDTKRRECRSYQRENDAPVNPQLARAVYAGGVDQLVGDGQDELTQ